MSASSIERARSEGTLKLVGKSTSELGLCGGPGATTGLTKRPTTVSALEIGFRWGVVGSALGSAATAPPLLRHFGVCWRVSARNP